MSDPRNDNRQPAPLTTDTFRSFVEMVALKTLRGALSEDEAKRIAGQTALGFFTAMRTAKNPADIINCTRESILSAIATSVATRLVVGTPNAPAYLVPQRPRRDAPLELQFRINHRGWAILFLRSGFLLDPVPVHMDDVLSLEDGQVRHSPSPDQVPTGWDDLKGVIVYATHIESRLRIAAWVPRVVIEQRRSKSRDGSIWNAWPVEMGMGAAVRYCVARGKLPIDSMAVQAALDAEPRVIDAQAESVAPATSRPAPSGRAALGLEPEPAALPDYGEPVDELADLRQPEREAVPAQAEVVPPPTAQQQPATGGASLVAAINRSEAALLASGGPEAVAAARKAANLDPQMPVEEMTEDEARAYRVALRSA